jgi:hypothetical protein
MSARAQSFDGTFRGSLVCEKAPAAADMLSVPLDMNIRGNNVQFARPLFNLDGTRVIGSELGTGTIDPLGNLHLKSNWYRFGVTFDADYSGALTKTGGTFSGTQSWRDGKKIIAENERAQRLWCLRRRSIKLARNNEWKSDTSSCIFGETHAASNIDSRRD